MKPMITILNKVVREMTSSKAMSMFSGKVSLMFASQHDSVWGRLISKHNSYINIKGVVVETLK